MQSWSLERFVKDKGLKEAMRVTQFTTRQGVYAAYERIQIVQLKNEYEVWLKKKIRSVPIKPRKV